MIENFCHQLRVNIYRVLMTRGRDGFIMFVPNENTMRSTFEALKGAGAREITEINGIKNVEIQNYVEVNKKTGKNSIAYLYYRNGY